MTDAEGNWSFNVDEDLYTGGDTLFMIDSDQFSTTTIVSGLDEESEVVIIDFVVDDQGNVLTINVVQDDFDDDLDDEIAEETNDINQDIDEAFDDVDDEADDLADDIDDAFDDAFDGEQR